MLVAPLARSSRICALAVAGSGVDDAGADVPLAVLARGGVGSPGQRVKPGKPDSSRSVGYPSYKGSIRRPSSVVVTSVRSKSLPALERPVDRGQPLFAGGTVVRRKIQVLSHASRRSDARPRPTRSPTHILDRMTEGRQPQLPSPSQSILRGEPSRSWSRILLPGRFPPVARTLTVTFKRSYRWSGQ